MPCAPAVFLLLAFSLVCLKDRRLMEQKELGHRQGRLDMRGEQNRNSLEVSKMDPTPRGTSCPSSWKKTSGESGNDVERQLECRRASAKEDNI